MKRRLQRAAAVLNRRDGSVQVEMAISSTILFAFLFGICQMSYALYIYEYASDAARQAARYASVRGNTSCTNTPSLSNCGVTSDQVQSWIRNLKYPGIRTSNVSVTASWCAASTTTPTGGTPTTSWAACSSSTSSAPGNLVQVVVSYPLSFIIPFSNSTSLSIGATSEMVVTQ